MKILVVDDEALVGQYVTQCIREAEPSSQIIAAVSSGARALQVLSETTVDVAFVDITMPKMDGLELLCRIKAEYPSVMVLMLTCHDEFEYARQAMQNKAENYILKSELTPEYMKKVLEDTRKARKDRGVVQQTSLLKQKDYLKKLIQEEGTCIVTEENLRKHNIFLRDDAFLALCFENDDRNFAAVMSATEAGYENPVVYPYNEDLTIVLLNLRRTDHQWASLEELHAELGNRLRQMEPALTGALGYSRPFFHMARIATAIREALESHNDRFYESAYPGELPYEERKKRLQRLMTEAAIRIEKSQWGPALTTLREAADYAGTHHADAMTLKRTAGQVCAILEDRASVELGVCTKRLESADTFSHLEAGLRTMMTALELQGKQLSTAIRNALAYIEQTYTEELTLNRVADHVFLNREYLSRRFKKEVGVTVSEYLNTCRLRRAKELLETTDLRISEVAERVGIPNVSYFSTVFRKEFACSPSDLRPWRTAKSSQKQT